MAKKKLSDLKVALVQDWLTSEGGAERVLFDLHEIWPDAPIYTLVYEPKGAPAWLGECDVRTTYLQNIPGAKSHYKMLLSLMPRAWEELDLTEFDLVVSACNACCKGVLTRPDALHICFCHSPMRYVWDLYFDYKAGTDPIRRTAMQLMVPKVREWDYLAAQRVDEFVSNSDYVGQRIAKFYRRESTTIHPASPIMATEVGEPQGYYLTVSRFVRYKRIDLAIEACNLLGRRLVVVGSGGEEEERLRELAGPTVEFCGRVSDEELASIYQGADAFLFPGIEDYGLTPVEAMASGVPVLAFGEGGATETVREGETGLFFHEQSPGALAACIERFEQEGVSLSRAQVANYGRSFSSERFRREFAIFTLQKLTERGII